MGNVNQLLFRALHTESAQRQQLSELHSLRRSRCAPGFFWQIISGFWAGIYHFIVVKTFIQTTLERSS